VKPAADADPLVCVSGPNSLMESSAEHLAAWVERLSFFLGSDWMPQGYGCGVCRCSQGA